MPVLSPIYVFCGDDEHAKRTKLAAARAWLVGNNDPALCLTEYDGEESNLPLARVLDDVRTMPFLADRRVVIVHRADPFIQQHRIELENYLAAPAACGVLVLVARTFPANTKLAKKLEALNGVRRYDRPKGRAGLLGWMAERAAEAGKLLQRGAAEALLDAVGEEPGLLEPEIAKLSVFVGTRSEITEADVEEATADNRTAAVFELSDALGTSQPEPALRIINSLCAADRAAPYKLVGYLARHLRRLSQARAALDRGADDRSVCKAAGYNWVHSSFLGQVRRFSADKLRSLRGRLAEADLSIKSQPDDPRRVIERFVFAALTNAGEPPIQNRR